MLVPLTLLPSVFLLFSLTHSAAEGRPVSSIVTAVRPDSGVDTVQVPLTEDLLTRYIGVKKDLAEFWSSHSNLLATAKSTGQSHAIEVPGGGRRSVGVFDYPALATKEPALAAVFTQRNLKPGEFAPTQVTVYKALYGIAAADAGKGVTTNDIAGKNVALVKARTQELAKVGVAVTQGQAGSSLGHAAAVGQAAPQLAVTKWINPASDWQPKFGDGHVYVVDFTAEWCGPCQGVYPVLEDVKKKYASRGVRIVSATALWGAYAGVNVSPEAELDSLKHYFPARHVTNPVAIFDAPMNVMTSGYFEGNSINLPRIVVIDGKGIVRSVLSAGQESEIDAAVAAADSSH
jgi:thiol-disulfide isomerase/thioredoxin